MLRFRDQKVLVIAPHPDDEVFGCGGFLHRVKREGGKVFVLYLTVGTTKDFSKSGFSTEKERIGEIARVARFLKFDGYRVAFPGDGYHLQLDTLPQRDLIHEIERGKRISLEAVRPTLVVAPSHHDYNQDHRAASQAVVTATRPAPPTFKTLQRMVLFSELPCSSWTCGEEVSSLQNFFVELKRENVEAKLKAIKLYKSQVKERRGPLSSHGVKRLAELRGVQCGVNAAEAFHLKRLLS